jgi:hypothetical protein
MKTKLFVLASVAALIVACGSKDAPAPAPTPSPAPAPAPAPAAKAIDNNSSGNPLTAPVDYLGTIAKAKHTADKGIETAALNQQVQLFFAQEGRYPKDLNEFVTMNYMKSLPVPPFGMEFKYDAAKGTVAVVPK